MRTIALNLKSPCGNVPSVSRRGTGRRMMWCAPTYALSDRRWTPDGRAKPIRSCRTHPAADGNWITWLARNLLPTLTWGTGPVTTSGPGWGEIGSVGVPSQPGVATAASAVVPAAPDAPDAVEPPSTKSASDAAAEPTAR